jgi:hypothetical protein
MSNHDSRKASECTMIMSEIRSFATSWIIDKKYDEGHNKNNLLNIPNRFFNENKHIKIITSKSERVDFFKGEHFENHTVLFYVSLLLAERKNYLHLYAEINDDGVVSVRRINNLNLDENNNLLFSYESAVMD